MGLEAGLPGSYCSFEAEFPERRLLPQAGPSAGAALQAKQLGDSSARTASSDTHSPSACPGGPLPLMGGWPPRKMEREGGKSGWKWGLRGLDRVLPGARGLGDCQAWPEAKEVKWWREASSGGEPVRGGRPGMPEGRGGGGGLGSSEEAGGRVGAGRGKAGSGRGKAWAPSVTGRGWPAERESPRL